MATLKDLIDLGNITLGNGTKIKFTQNKHYPLKLLVNDGKEIHYWLEKDGKLFYDGHDVGVDCVEETSE